MAKKHPANLDRMLTIGSHISYSNRKFQIKNFEPSGYHLEIYDSSAPTEYAIYNSNELRTIANELICMATQLEQLNAQK